jgi:hypothetical protein
MSVVKYAVVDPKLVQQVVADLAEDRAAGGWHGGEPDPTLTAVTRVLHSLGRLGYSVHGKAVVEPRETIQLPSTATACTAAPLPMWSLGTYHTFHGDR